MAWHNAGTYQITDGRGGGAGSQRFAALTVPTSTWRACCSRDGEPPLLAFGRLCPHRPFAPVLRLVLAAEARDTASVQKPAPLAPAGQTRSAKRRYRLRRFAIRAF